MSSAVELHRPGSALFETKLSAVLSGPPAEWLRPALPYSAIAENRSEQALALVGIRFDMITRKGRKISVVHLADTLRNPEKTEFPAGGLRFFCAEPEYASAVARGADDVSLRAKLNLENLRTVLRTSVSIDCVAFADGRFEGPDSGGAFERLAAQRESEQALIASVLNGGRDSEFLRPELNSRDSARRTLAARLLHANESGGAAAMLEFARRYRCRIPLVRSNPEKK